MKKKTTKKKQQNNIYLTDLHTGQRKRVGFSQNAQASQIKRTGS